MSGYDIALLIFFGCIVLHMLGLNQIGFGLIFKVVFGVIKLVFLLIKWVLSAGILLIGISFFVNAFGTIATSIAYLIDDMKTRTKS